MEEVKSLDSSWNKKRIFIAAFLLLLLIAGGIFFKNQFLPKETASQPEKSVEGASTTEETTYTQPKINIQEIMSEKIDSLKQQVSSLNIAEIAASSPQVQKILNDIKSLEQYPANQARAIICKQVCDQ